MGVQHGPELLEREALTWRLFLGVSAGALLVTFAVFALGVTGGLAAGQHCGTASWYGQESCVNKRDCRTANGERYTGKDMTAAHRTLPFGTRLKVTYKGRSVVVRLNDRGPAAYTGRDLDLSKATAQKLGLIPAGVGKVCWTVVG